MMSLGYMLRLLFESFAIPVAAPSDTSPKVFSSPPGSGQFFIIYDMILIPFTLSFEVDDESCPQYSNEHSDTRVCEKQQSSRAADTWEDELSEHYIRAWAAFSAAGLQGQARACMIL